MIKKRLEYGLLLLASIVFHIFLVDYLSFFVLIFFLALPVFSLLIMLFLCRSIAVELEIKSFSIQKNESLPIRLKVRNTSFFIPCPIRVELTIRNELTQEELSSMFFITAGYKRQTIKQTLSSKYCGKLDCRIRELRIYDCLGLFSFRRKTDNRKSYTVFVLPFVYPLMGMDSKNHQSVEHNKSLQIKIGDDPSEIFDIREYRDGDRLSRVHWKLFNKYDQLMVKDFGIPISNDVLLLLDLNGDNKELDGMLDAMNSISCFLLENQINHEIGWYESHNGRFLHNGIVKKDDLNMVLNTVLSAPRVEKQSLVLSNFINIYDSGRYSDVIYLCSEISSDCVILLCEKMSESWIHILLAAQPASLQNIDVSLTADMKVILSVLDLENIGQSLNELVL